MSHLKNPLVNDFSKRCHLRRKDISAEAWRKLGGSVVEGPRKQDGFGESARKLAEASRKVRRSNRRRR